MPIYVAPDGTQFLTFSHNDVHTPASRVVTGPVDAPVEVDFSTAANQAANIAAINKLGSAKRWASVAPSDNNDLASIPDAISCEGNAGTIAMQGSDGVAETFYFEKGQTRALSPKRVLVAGTTATGIKAQFS